MVGQAYSCAFFFFKQKTAYEMATRLEFRRVLFRSFDIAYQISLPPWSYDLSDAGKKMSGDWLVMTTYNTEFATTNLEINASQNDRDYIVMINWKQLEEDIANGEYEEVNGEKMVDPRDHKGAIYAVTVTKSHHGEDVTPDRTRFLASG